MTFIDSGLPARRPAARRENLNLDRVVSKQFANFLCEHPGLFARQQPHVDFRRRLSRDHIDLVRTLDAGYRDRIAHPGIVARSLRNSAAKAGSCNALRKSRYCCAALPVRRCGIGVELLHLRDHSDRALIAHDAVECRNEFMDGVIVPGEAPWPGVPVAVSFNHKRTFLRHARRYTNERVHPRRREFRRLRSTRRQRL